MKKMMYLGAAALAVVLAGGCARPEQKTECNRQYDLLKQESHQLGWTEEGLNKDIGMKGHWCNSAEPVVLEQTRRMVSLRIDFSKTYCEQQWQKLLSYSVHVSNPKVDFVLQHPSKYCNNASKYKSVIIKDNYDDAKMIEDLVLRFREYSTVRPGE